MPILRTVKYKGGRRSIKLRSGIKLRSPGPALRSRPKSTKSPFYEFVLSKFEPVGLRFGYDIHDFMATYYKEKNMSTGEIKEMLKENGIDVHLRIVVWWLKISGIKARTPKERFTLALRKRRVDYKSRHIDYLRRKIDYRKRDFRWAVGLGDLLSSEEKEKRFLETMGVNESLIVQWKNLSTMVSKKDQNKICKYFEIENSEIFCRTK